MKSMNQCLTFSTAYELLRVPSDAVVYIEADGNYSTLHLANGESSVVSMQLGQIVYLIMNTVEPGDERFVRIDRRLIINCDYVFDIQIQKQKLTLSDCRTFKYSLKPSQNKLRQLKEQLEMGSTYVTETDDTNLVPVKKEKEE